MEKKTVEENMSLYNRVRQVPEEAKKPFDTGRFKGTDINPMWRIKVLTENFGPCCKKQVFDQQFSEKLDSADFGKLVLHIVIDKAVMRQRAAASLLGA